ncbi:MAG: stage II sporulation protein E [Clostridia bacterium]|nr:stage II sporulation protein E [Clostridia bacterium]
MKTEAMLQQKLSDAAGAFLGAKDKRRLAFIPAKKEITLLVLAFLLGRVSLLGGIMPFGTAVFASTMELGLSRILISILVLLGMVTAGGKEQIYVSAAAMLIMSALNMPFSKSKTKHTLRDAVIAFISVLIPQIILVVLQGMLLYDLLKALLEGFILFSLVFVLKNALPLFSPKEIRQKVFTNEEIISIAIVTALALAGLGNIGIFGITLKNVLSILIIMAFSFKCGPGVGAATGVTVGIVSSMSNTISPLIIGTYAFCGLLSGIFRKLGRVGVSLGFVMGNALLTLYMNGSVEVLVHLKEIIVAVLFFIFLPQKVISVVAGRFASNTDTNVYKDNYSQRIKEMTVERLKRFSRAFGELSKTFGEISETKVVTDKQDISALFDRVADKVCKDCSVCLHCWDRNFYNTYQVLFKIVERLDSKGRIEESDIPEYFLSRCERINDFVKSVNSMYELFKVDMVWKSRIGESRGLVSQQLEGLAKIISNLASEIDVNVRFKGELEDSIMMELSRAGIKVNDAIAIENKWGKYEVSIFHKGCGSKRNCVTTIENLVSNLVGRKMIKEESECYNRPATGICALRLVEEEAYKVTTGVARVTKHENSVSGDNYTFMNSGDGKYIVALSDGMGSGQKASLQSRATVNLLEQFMEAGFDKDTTVKLINSVLVLKSDDDSFATIDLSVIDLYDGKVEFVKIGAVPTFIKRSSGVELVKSISLPAGILSNIEVNLVDKKIEDGDFIIMMSDGVLDSFKDEEEDSSRIIQRFIQDIHSINPQEIADAILDEAYLNSQSKPGDDMTVLVAKVWKKVG